MRETFIHELRTMAKWYNISYPASAKLLREAACELEEKEKETNLFIDCLRRAGVIFKEIHPEVDYWLDGAENLAWALGKLEDIRKIAEKATQSNGNDDVNDLCGWLEDRAWGKYLK